MCVCVSVCLSDLTSLPLLGVGRKSWYIIIIPKRMLGRLLEVKVWRGEGGGMSDHFLVESRRKLVGGWRSAGKMEGVRNVMKVSETNNSVKEMKYQESLHGKYEVWRGGELECGE